MKKSHFCQLMEGTNYGVNTIGIDIGASGQKACLSSRTRSRFFASK